MIYNFDFKVGLGSGRERVNLSARYHGVRKWTYPNRPSFWQLDLLELDLFVFSYWSVMRQSLGFHVEYWIDKLHRRYEDATIEIRQSGRISELRELEVVEWVEMADIHDRRKYWTTKWIEFGEWKANKHSQKYGMDLPVAPPIEQLNPIDKSSDLPKALILDNREKYQYRCDVNSTRLFYLFVLICKSKTLMWWPLFRFTWFRTINYQKEYFNSIAIR